MAHRRARSGAPSDCPRPASRSTLGRAMLDDLRLTLQQNIGAELTPELCARLYASMLFRPPTGIEPERFTPMEWGGFTFQAERISDVLGELHELHRLHWQETEGYRAGVMMNPDYEAMKDAESAGRMIQFTARREGAVVGNLRMYLSNSLHTQRLIATEDSLFVHPD